MERSVARRREAEDLARRLRSDGSVGLGSLSREMPEGWLGVGGLRLVAAELEVVALMLKQEEGAEAAGEPAVADFNGCEIIAKLGDDPGTLRAAWEVDRRAASERYRSSPDGQAEKARIDAANLAALAEAKKPLAIFDCVDADAWASWVAANKDGYGAAIIRYAARWAALMEERLSASVAPLEQIAKQASHDADTEGITGFMYGAAVSMLSKVWRHGDALRRWHNISTQIGTEGEEANAKGGTLNPALLVVR